jgi:hypothetical protein
LLQATSSARLNSFSKRKCSPGSSGPRFSGRTSSLPVQSSGFVPADHSHFHTTEDRGIAPERSSKDGKLAHQILVDIGVVQTQTPADTTAQNGAYDEETEVLIMTGRLVQAAAVRAQTYGIPLEKIGYGLKDVAKKFLADRSV